jgi:predicted membrane metal-binding protein
LSEEVVDNGKLDNPKLISDEESQGFGSGVRQKVVDFFQQVLPQPFFGTVAGITLGYRGAISADFWQKIKNTRVVYIVSVSG